MIDLQNVTSFLRGPHQKFNEWTGTISFPQLFSLILLHLHDSCQLVGTLEWYDDCWDSRYQQFHAMNVSSIYSRTPPCGHPTFVDTPPLWTLSARPVCLWPWPHIVSLVGTPRYCGHFLFGPQVSTLPRFYCILQARLKKNVRKVWQSDQKIKVKNAIEYQFSTMVLDWAVAVNVALHWGRTFFLNLATL